MENEFAELPDAPRKFKVQGDECVGRPSVAYGAARRLAFEERCRTGASGVRVLFSKAGHHGGPTGGLSLEVLGVVYTFNGGLANRPDLHRGGIILPEGEKLLANGLPGSLTKGWDWRWVQDEVDLTSLIPTAGVRLIAEQHERWHSRREALPLYQVHGRALRAGAPIIGHNCTSIIVEQLQRAGLEWISGWFPLAVFDALKLRTPNRRSALDNELNFLLWQDEPQLLRALEMLSSKTDWSKVAKGESDCDPKSTCHEVISCVRLLTDYSHLGKERR